MDLRAELYIFILPFFFFNECLSGIHNCSPQFHVHFDALSYLQFQGCLQILRVQLVGFSAPTHLLLPQKDRQRRKNLRNALLGLTVHLAKNSQDFRRCCLEREHASLAMVVFLLCLLSILSCPTSQGTSEMILFLVAHYGLVH